MSQPAISIRSLHVVRSGKVVLGGLDLDVPAGQIVGLLGPSGGGKSTLMRAIVGVQVVKSGQVTVLGQAAGAAGLRRQVGYMTQTPSVYRDLTVAENLAYFAALAGVGRAQVNQVIDRVQLTEYANRTVARLSGGQVSRVSLAAALLGRPKLLVLDEPTVGLDPVLRRDLWVLFHELANEGITQLISSHVMDEATRCDRLVLLREGRILADDTPAQLLEATGAADVEGAFLALEDAAAGEGTDR
jgi:ABC-2 type transport system ATP-binding protein